MEKKQITIKLPHYVLETAQRLISNGYQAYLVGGALRDTLLGKLPDDYDIATDAHAHTLLKLFRNAKEVGVAFGTVLVPIYLKEEKKYVNIEITTFRIETDYRDYRHPSKVEFVTDINEDLKRRDFTINAMAVNLEQAVSTLKKGVPKNHLYTLTLDLLDPYGGYSDLRNKLIKAVGDPLARFREDPLRAFRACRFRAQLEFEIEENTYNAILQVLDLIKFISKERIQTELVKLLTQAKKPSLGIECMRKTGLLQFVIPELLDCYGVTQPLGHTHDVYHHLLYTTDKAPPKLEVRLAALLHDIGKPQTKRPDGHFYGHDVLSAQMAKKILKRLRFSNRIIQHVTTLIRWHMFYYPNYLEDFKEKTPPSKWSDAAVRRFIRRVGLEYLDDLFALRIADATSNPKAEDPYPEINALKKHIKKVLDEDSALKVSDLKVDGHDIMGHLKIPQGPLVGEILNYLLERVLDDPKLNTKQKLLKLAEEYLKTKQKSR